MPTATTVAATFKVTVAYHHPSYSSTIAAEVIGVAAVMAKLRSAASV